MVLYEIANELEAVVVAQSLLDRVKGRQSRHQQIGDIVAYIRRFPYLQLEDGGFVWSLGLAGRLADVAAEEADLTGTEQAYRNLEASLMAALEVVAGTRSEPSSP